MIRRALREVWWAWQRGLDQITRSRWLLLAFVSFQLGYFAWTVADHNWMALLPLAWLAALLNAYRTRLAYERWCRDRAWSLARESWISAVFDRTPPPADRPDD